MRRQVFARPSLLFAVSAWLLACGAAQREPVRSAPAPAPAASVLDEAPPAPPEPAATPAAAPALTRDSQLYAGQLALYFKRGWLVPDSLGDVTSLVVEVEIVIQSDRTLGEVSIIRSSGDALFDSTVRYHLEGLRAQGARVPEPAPELAPMFLGQPLRLRFRDSH